MDPWFKENLVCPHDKTKLELIDNKLVCVKGHEYYYVDGVPVMLLDNVKPTHFIHDISLQIAQLGEGFKTEYEIKSQKGGIDPYVLANIAHTCGTMYAGLINNLTDYPIPELQLPDAEGKYFLDIGCNWGRWCVAAARKGYNPVGMDHSLLAIRAAKRIAKQLGVKARFLVADARYMPFKSEIFDVAYSFSVIQHLKKVEARKALAEIPRVLKHSGLSMVQMPNVYGLRNIYSQIKITIQGEEIAGVNYWSPSELSRTFNAIIGPSKLSIDSFLTLNAQKTDVYILPTGYRLVVYISEALKKLSKKMKWMIYLADAIFVESTPAYDDLTRL